jgi:hypothetical protein
LNIWDAFSKTKSHPSTNTDGQGHGTHVSGTIGGINVGVSPQVNLYGLKVLSDEGSGSTSDIVSALDFAMAKAASSGRRSVLTMSLGGPCDEDDCSKDSLVIASEKLISAGIILSVAAGNEGCNACSGSPNSAPHTINVGASDDSDSLCYFSNFGQCVDIIAPGYDILSACSSKICGGSDYYLTMSGTSMATPHVAGVIAQLLQKYPTAMQPEILKFMTCDSIHDSINVGSLDGITKNLLLRVPASSDTTSTCSPSSGCTPECSSLNGVCLPMYAPSIPDYSTSPKTCHCNGGTYGTTCSASSDTSCDASNNNKQKVTMYDQFGDGWSFTSYAILDTNGYIYNNIYDSLCYDDFGTRDYCLPDGNYQFVVNRGPYPNEVAWDFCGVSGGAPYSANFVMTSGGKTCSISCPNASKQTLYLFDSYGDGWNGAYYSIYDESGEQLYGGMLPNEQESGSHTVCLPTGKYYLIFPLLGSNPEEISMKINDMILYPDSAAILVVDSSFHVSVAMPSTSQCTQSDVSGTSPLNAIGLLKINLLSKGWQSGTYEVTNALSHTVVASGGMQSGFLELDTMCIPDGCYNFNAQLASSNDVQLSDNKNSFWTACGSQGLIPWQSKFCIEGQYDLCYGIDGSPYAKSYARHSSGQYMILSHFVDEYDMSVVDLLTNVHGVNDFSGLDDGCYSFILGAGKDLVAGRDSVYFSCDDMKLPYKMPTSGEICVNDIGTTCTITHFTRQTCTGSMIPILFAKFDLNGDGWGTDRQAYYRIKDKDSKIVAHGNLKVGQYGVDKICLNVNQCFKLSVDSTSYPEDVLWLHCGLVGGAGADYKDIEFCVTQTGCYFMPSGDGVYYKELDDDFPQVPSISPTFMPSVASTLMPTRKPTSDPTRSRSPTMKPTLLPSLSLSPSFKPTTSSPTTSSPTTQMPTSETSVASPTSKPIAMPTRMPTDFSSTQKPTPSPTKKEPATAFPSSEPTTTMTNPTTSRRPTYTPSMKLTAVPSISRNPTLSSSFKPSSSITTREPTISPSSTHKSTTLVPTIEPTTAPPTISFEDAEFVDVSFALELIGANLESNLNAYRFISKGIADTFHLPEEQILVDSGEFSSTSGSDADDRKLVDSVSVSQTHVRLTDRSPTQRPTTLRQPSLQPTTPSPTATINIKVKAQFSYFQLQSGLNDPSITSPDKAVRRLDVLLQSTIADGTLLANIEAADSTGSIDLGGLILTSKIYTQNSPTVAPTTDSAESTGLLGLSTGPIVGIAVASALVLIAVGFVIYKFVRINSSSRHQTASRSFAVLGTTLGNLKGEKGELADPFDIDIGFDVRIMPSAPALLEGTVVQVQVQVQEPQPPTSISSTPVAVYVEVEDARLALGNELGTYRQNEISSGSSCSGSSNNIRSNYGRVASRDYTMIYAHLMDRDMALDHSQVIQCLRDMRCKCSDDIEFLDETDLDKLVELMMPGLPMKKLLKLLQRQ